MARRPLSTDERRARTRALVFLGAVLVIVVLVVATFAVFGPFLERFGGL